MNRKIFDFFDTTKSHRIVERLRAGASVNLSNVKDGLKGFLALYLREATKGHLLYITATDREALAKAERLAQWAPDNVLYFPEEPIHDYFSDVHSREITEKRMQVLEQLLGRRKYVICTSVSNLLKKMPASRALRKRFLTLKPGMTLEPGDLAAQLSDRGYIRVSQVESAGQYAKRGEIVDVFPVGAATGVRADFFDDELESLKQMDMATQRSALTLTRIKIAPVRESILSRGEREQLLKTMAARYGGAAHAALIDRLLAEPMEHDETFSAFAGEGSSLESYLGKQAVIFWDEWEQAAAAAETFLEKSREDFETLIDAGELFPEEGEKFWELDALTAALSRRPTVKANLFSDMRSEAAETFDMSARSIESFVGRVPYFCDMLKQHLENGDRIVIGCRSAGGEKAVRTLLGEQDLGVYSDGTTPGVYFARGEFSEGFELPAEHLVFISQSEIFKPAARKKRRRKKPSGKKIETFTSLSAGDYVVHDIHGIGVYQGIEKMTIGETTKDMIVIAYQGDDRLYLPVDQMGSIQAYIGTGGDRKPKVNTLGRPDWAKTKARAKKAVEDMADELIALYAARRSRPGYAFGKDTSWQREFEDAFPYEETDDQLRCIEEIKADMEKPVPMDRLLCGDVGYGKTEVALRAAFKAVMDSKQVALLVPTTILAQQHYETMRSRFARYPITVEVMSRFRTPKEQKAVLADLAAGRVDVVVGTHRLLSKDMRFKDLGLLIVDEEQRFGVRAKEKLKSLRENVDVLTLSATPIPRTLHMSMTGIRDMSVIAEPPAGRRPVRTYVMRDNAVVVGDAIAREIRRGGQVYFVHNRIKDLNERADQVRRMVPGARVVTAHGQMPGEALERIMQAFVDKAYDVLVTTAIVESGLDVRNANTMVVDDGDAMGLSQLYQLRGRVGRSSNQAFCYILYKRRALSDVAQKRLKAIKDFTAFGSGFKVAMRDLEIRGAGNILGAEQSGHLFSIGYEMYCRILEETIAEHTGHLPEAAAGKEPVKINLELDAYIPETYIDSEVVKYDIYKKIAALADENDLADMTAALEDRFGPVPASVRNLLKLSVVGRMAEACGIVELRQQRDRVLLFFDEAKPVPMPAGDRVQLLFARFGVKFKADKHWDKVWSIALGGRIQAKMLDHLMEFFKKIQ